MPGGGKEGRPLKMRLDIWDTVGNERITRSSYTYKCTDAFVVVYSVVSLSSFRSVDMYM